MKLKLIPVMQHMHYDVQVSCYDYMKMMFCLGIDFIFFVGSLFITLHVIVLLNLHFTYLSVSKFLLLKSIRFECK